MMQNLLGIFILVTISSTIQENNSGHIHVSFYDDDANFLGSAACSSEMTIADMWTQTPVFQPWQSVNEKLLFFDRISGRPIANPSTALCMEHVDVFIVDLSSAM